MVLFIGLGLLVSTAYAGFNIGIQGAVKQRVEKLDEKVKNKGISPGTDTSPGASNLWLFIDEEGSNEIDLWIATSQDVDGFNLYRKTPDTSWQKLNASLIPSDFEDGVEWGDFSDNTIVLGTRYIYQTKAVKGGQEILTSNEAAVTFQGVYNPPLMGGTPADGATGVGVNPTFAWDSVPNAARYEICVFDANDELKWLILTNGPVTSIKYGSSAGSVLVGPKPLQQGQVYSWEIEAYDQYYHCIGGRWNEYDFTP